MKLFTYHTPSHSSMLKKFLLPSVNAFGEYDIMIGTGPQICSDGHWNSDKFGETSTEKLKFVLNANTWNDHENVILFCDADVIFLKPTKQFFMEQIKEYDMIFQNDDGTCNTGVYICRCNERVRSLLESAVEISPQFHDEQYAINHIIHTTGVRYKLFGSLIWNISFEGNREIWNGQSPIKFPDNIALFHANWMQGCELKEKALQMAKDHFTPK